MRTPPPYPVLARILRRMSYDNMLDTLRYSFRFERLGGGCYKVAYGHPHAPYVVRMCTSYEGAQEVENYAQAPAHIRRFLLPILAHYYTRESDRPGFQIQARVNFKHTARCPGWWVCPACTAVSDTLEDHNHIHLPNGAPLVFDYGFCAPWRHDADTKVHTIHARQLARVEERRLREENHVHELLAEGNA